MAIRARAETVARWRFPINQAVVAWRHSPYTTPRRLAGFVAAVALALVAAWLVSTGRGGAALALAVGVPGAALVLRFPFAGLLAWLIVLPYFLQDTTSADPALWVLHRAMLPGLAVLLVVYHAVGIRRASFRFGAGDWALAAFLVLGVVNIVVLSDNAPRMMVAFYDKIALPILAFWLIRAMNPGRRELRWLVVVGIWTVIVQATIGILSWFAPSVLPDQWLGRAGERTIGTFGGPAPYTITIVLFALLAVDYVRHVRDRVARLAILAVIAAGSLAVFLSLSRGSWLGAGVALAGLLLVYPKVGLRLAIVGLVVVAGLGLGPLRSEIEYAQARVSYEPSIAGRIVTDDAAIQMISTKPLTGFGYGNFETFDEAFKRQVGDIPLAEGVGGSAHNTYLALAAENGIPGLLLYLAPVAWLAASTWRARRRLVASELDWRLAAVLWLAVVDQLIVTNFMDMLHAKLWGTTLYWLALGLIAVVVRVDASRPKAPEQPAAWAARSR